jgi:hypothetical protein
MMRFFLFCLVLISFSSFGANNIYTCDSQYGSIVVRELKGGKVNIDFSEHEVKRFRNAYSVFQQLVLEGRENFNYYTLNISKENLSGFKGTKFSNNKFGLTLKSKFSSLRETCQVSFKLNKFTDQASLTYRCAFLVRSQFSFQDVLNCSTENSNQ